MPSQLYYNGTIVTVDSSRRIILDGAILVSNDRIIAIGKSSDLKSSPDLPQAVTQVDLEQRIVIPGLINGHVHLIQSLMRGLAENMELHSWASCAIWPLEVAFEGDDEPMLPSYDGIKFDEVVKAVGESGIRACLGKLVKTKRSDPLAGIHDSRDELADKMSVSAALDAHKHHHGSFNGRLHVWMAAETPRGQDESGFLAVGTACHDHNIRLTVHCAEAPGDKDLIQEHYKATPVEFCRNTKATGSHVVLAHMTHLDERDYGILQETGTSVAHNPTSNAKLADGIAPIPQLLKAGVNVCIGTDGAPCNNGHDLFRDMHLAGILHKAIHNDATLLPAEQVLEMATVNAAKALGIDHEAGSLEVGKKADFVVLDHSGLHAAPYNPSDLRQGGLPVPTLVVHSLSGVDVQMVVVDGEVLVADGKLTRLDETKIKANAYESILGIRKRSQVSCQSLKRGWVYV